MKITKKLRYIIIFIALSTISAAVIAITHKKTQTLRQQKREENYKVVKMTGGLGNQMFQYAFGLALAEESNCEVYYDLSFYEDEEQLNRPTVEEMAKNEKLCDIISARREYCLKYFNVNCKVADSERIKNCTSQIDENFVREKGISNFNNGQHEYIYDCFETIDLFDYEKYRDVFTRKFTLTVPMDQKNKDMLNKIKTVNSVAIHIRRTDHGDILGYSNMKYYDRAVKHIVAKVENPHFFIFSDDMDWVKENFGLNIPDILNNPYTFVDINDDATNYYDFEQIRNCKHQILANSTFSWWATWLNPNEDKIVTAPTPWLKNGDTRDKMMPKDWIRIQEN
ncbi:MAG: alpha-1,2-fucosyltransferase [Oscillospiraceae bacterium]|nr:alpha-1,2-fucosyltransferase [Oscillospiraceae bacterium]